MSDAYMLGKGLGLKHSPRRCHQSQTSHFANPLNTKQSVEKDTALKQQMLLNHITWPVNGMIVMSGLSDRKHSLWNVCHTLWIGEQILAASNVHFCPHQSFICLSDHRVSLYSTIPSQNRITHVETVLPKCKIFITKSPSSQIFLNNNDNNIDDI